MAEGLLSLDVKAVLIKGGHSNDSCNATDYLAVNNMPTIPFTTTRLHTSHTHGTGCVLSSAIAIHLAKAETLEKSVEKAKDFLYQKLHTSSALKFRYRCEGIERKEPLL
jgi:hydroxymethylpyrimidine/phosphomethylpyrimidine kinase